MVLHFSVLVAADGTQTLTVGAVAVTLTLPAAYVATTTHGLAIIQVRTAPILYTLNGVAPIAADESTGTKVNAGETFQLDSIYEMQNLKMIRATATSGAVFVQYERHIN